MKNISDFDGFCQKKFLEEAQARLDAKREERRRLYPSAADIPIKTAGELVSELLPQIPIVLARTPDGDEYPLMDLYASLLDIVRRLRESL